jgi:hypothetical protein
MRTPPSAAEARAALSRVFGTAVTMVERPGPAVLAADLNGDESSDLVALVRPEAGSLDALNDDLAPWIVREPRASDPHTPRPRVGAADILLAVIHGDGAAGWRSDDARQAWLLRGTAGAGLRVLQGAELRALSGRQRLPAAGDVLAASIDGKPGVLFWTGAQYAWHPTRG